MCAGQDSDGVNAVVKYLLFFFNFIFWLIGCALIGLGAWAYIEKNRFYQSEIQSIYDILFDVSIGIIIVGCIIFIIAFAGCLGALRENITLLRIFSYLLGILFLLEVVGAILIFVFSGQGKEEVTKLFREEGIVRYRDDPDFQSIFDWVQETFHCCGVGHKGYRDWSMNVYFNCSDTNPSPEACAVPFSCCIRPNDVTTGHKNVMCGYDVQKLDSFEASHKVYIKGCVQGVIDEAKQNLVILGAAALALAVPQILGVFLAGCLAFSIQDKLENVYRQSLLPKFIKRGISKKDTKKLFKKYTIKAIKKTTVIGIDYGDDIFMDNNNNKHKPEAKDIHDAASQAIHGAQPFTPTGKEKERMPKGNVVGIDYGDGNFTDSNNDRHGKYSPETNVQLFGPSEKNEKRMLKEVTHYSENPGVHIKHVVPLKRMPQRVLDFTKGGTVSKPKVFKVPPVALLANHSWMTKNRLSQNRINKRKPRRKILNPLALPPIARAAGIDHVRCILRRQFSKCKPSGVRNNGTSMAVAAANGPVTMSTNERPHSGMISAAPLKMSTNGKPRNGADNIEAKESPIRTMEQPRRKSRIYPQRELRDLCSASDIVNLNMSVLSSPTVQQTPKLANLPDEVASRSGQSTLTIADVHATDQPDHGATAGGQANGEAPYVAPTMLALRKMLQEHFGHQHHHHSKMQLERPPSRIANEPLPDYIDTAPEKLYPAIVVEQSYHALGPQHRLEGHHQPPSQCVPTAIDQPYPSHHPQHQFDGHQQPPSQRPMGSTHTMPSMVPAAAFNNISTAHHWPAPVPQHVPYNPEVVAQPGHFETVMPMVSYVSYPHEVMQPAPRRYRARYHHDRFAFAHPPLRHRPFRGLYYLRHPRLGLQYY